MFKKSLGTDLSNIFENKKVVFAGEVDELRALGVEIYSVKEQAKDNGYFFRVSGRIFTVDDINGHYYGYYHDRIRQYRDRSVLDRFDFASREFNSNNNAIQGGFLETSLNFTYRVTVPYDTIRHNIKFKDVIFSITNIFKKKQENKK